MKYQANLINYLPEFLRDIREFKELTTVEDSEINLLWNGVDEAFNNQTVDTADEYGISRLEKIMNIIKKDTDLESRKTEIKSRLGQQLPYTEYTLRNSLAEFCVSRKSKDNELLEGFTLEVLPDKYTVNVLISSWNKSKKSVIDAMVRHICPANMQCNVDMKYNTYGELQQLKVTYAQLKKLTYKQIREEVLREVLFNIDYEDLRSLGITYEKLEKLTHQDMEVDFKSLVNQLSEQSES